MIVKETGTSTHLFVERTSTAHSQLLIFPNKFKLKVTRNSKLRNTIVNFFPSKLLSEKTCMFTDLFIKLAFAGKITDKQSPPDGGGWYAKFSPSLLPLANAACPSNKAEWYWALLHKFEQDLMQETYWCSEKIIILFKTNTKILRSN